MPLPAVVSRMLIGHQLCATCAQPVVKGPAMVIKALDLCFHVNCFKVSYSRVAIVDTLCMSHMMKCESQDYFVEEYIRLYPV